MTNCVLKIHSSIYKSLFVFKYIKREKEHKSSRFSLLLKSNAIFKESRIFSLENLHEYTLNCRDPHLSSAVN